jgi:hypothetical protein
MHHLAGADQHELLFGPYFVIPFGLVVAVLLLEIGVTGSQRIVLAVALALPVGLLALATVGHRPDGIYQTFLNHVALRLGGGPLFLTLAAAAGFYAYAALRRTPLAVEALTAALLGLAVVGPDTRNLSDLVAPQAAPILAAAGLQLMLGLWRRESLRCLLGTVGLVAAAALDVPAEIGLSPFRGLIAFHLGLLAVLLVGAAFDDVVARLLRLASAVLVLLACIGAMFGPVGQLVSLPPGTAEVYTLVMAAFLAGYGWLLGHRPSLVVAALALTCWAAALGYRGYASLRLRVSGLDYLALSLTLFALAVLVSLGKSGLLGRWLAARAEKVPRSAD